MSADGDRTTADTEIDDEEARETPAARPALFDDEVEDTDDDDQVVAVADDDEVGDDEVVDDAVDDEDATDDVLPAPGPDPDIAPVDDAEHVEEPDPTGIAMVVVEPEADEVVVTVPVPDLAEDPAAAPESAPAPRSRTSHVVLRHVRVRSVAKLSAVFYLSMCVVLLVAGVVLWVGASAAGVVGNVESFIQDAGFNDFRFLPGQLLRAFVVLGLTLMIVGTLANVLLAALFNTLSDIVGGLRVTLAEDGRAERGR